MGLEIFTTCRNGLSKACSMIKKLDVQHDRPPKPISNRQTIVPIAVVSIMFFVWGFAYGLLDIMNYHVRQAMGIPRERAALLGFGYYLAYIPGPLLLSGPLVSKCGYRLTLVVGLLLVAVGGFLTSVAAQHCTFRGMFGAMFIIGCGVSTLERAANPYTVNCGPRARGTLRILFAQAMAGVGTVVAPFVANKFLFAEVQPTATTSAATAELLALSTCGNLGTVISLYRGVAAVICGLTLAVAFVFFRLTVVPEVEVHKTIKTPYGRKFWKHPLLVGKAHHRFRWAAIANFFNMGCQVGFAQFFLEHLITNASMTKIKASQYMSVAQGLFVVGRFIAAGLALKPKLFKPRYVLFGAIAGAVAFTTAGAFVTMNAVIACAVLVMMFEGPLFPMIFESADVELGEYSALGETVMIVSISGGAVQTPLLGLLNNQVGVSHAWFLTAGCFCVVWTYGWANNLIPSFKTALDSAQCDEKSQSGQEEELGETTNNTQSSRNGSSLMTHAFHFETERNDSEVSALPTYVK